MRDARSLKDDAANLHEQRRALQVEIALLRRRLAEPDVDVIREALLTARYGNAEYLPGVALSGAQREAEAVAAALTSRAGGDRG